MADEVKRCLRMKLLGKCKKYRQDIKEIKVEGCISCQPKPKYTMNETKDSRAPKPLVSQKDSDPSWMDVQESSSTEISRESSPWGR